MMESVRNFIITLVAVTIIANAANMILPNGKIKKYSSFVISLIMSLIIITGAVGIVNKRVGYGIDFGIDEYGLNEADADLRYEKNLSSVFDVRFKQEVQRLVKDKNIEIISLKTNLDFESGEINEVFVEITGDAKVVEELLIREFAVNKGKIIINKVFEENGDKHG